MKHIAFLLALLLPFSISAASYSDIMNVAEEMSIEEKNAAISYESSLLSASLLDKEDEMGYSVSLRAEPFQYDDAISITALDASFIFPDEDTEISASIPFDVKYSGKGALLHPSLSLSHRFDWAHDDKRLSSLEAEYARFTAQENYDRAISSFRKNMISLMIALLENERDMKEAEETLSDLKKDFSDSVYLRTVTEGTVLYKELELLISRAEGSLSALKEEREYLEWRYTSYTGLEWDGVDDIPDAVFPSLEGESPSVKEAYYEMEIASEEYLVEKSRIKPLNLTLGGDVSSTVGIGELISSSAEENLKAGLSLALNTDEWNVEVSGGGSWDRNYSFTPSLSIGAVWSRNTEKDSDTVTLKRLMNDALSASNGYQKALIDDYDEKESLLSSILSWKRSYADAEDECAYRRAMLEYQEELYKRGLGTEEDLSDASLEAETAEYDLKIAKLNGLSLMLDALEYV